MGATTRNTNYPGPQAALVIITIPKTIFSGAARSTGTAGTRMCVLKTGEISNTCDEPNRGGSVAVTIARQRLENRSRLSSYDNIFIETTESSYDCAITLAHFGGHVNG
jgi:hypothetical protein